MLAISTLALAGFIVQEPEHEKHYTLFAPLRSTFVYLVDEAGEEVHAWNTKYQPGHEAKLLDDGRLLHTGKLKHKLFRGGGQGGRLALISPNGEEEWVWQLPDQYLQHHDVEMLPNGNLLAIAWEQKGIEAAELLGREENSVSRDGIWPDCLLEIKPIGKDDAEIVWEWHLWDHTVQDRDPEKENYGVIAENPRRVDINLGGIDKRADAKIEEEKDFLKELGYLGDDDEEEEITKPKNRPPGLPDHIGRNGGQKRTPAGGGRFQADWMHSNAVSYNADLDLIAISVRHFSEVFVIDHSTTIEEAATSKGGRYGHGGDILWRFGNPANYHQGSEADRVLFGQHDVRWIPQDVPGAGAITIFNNGEKNGRDWSNVVQVRPDHKLKENRFNPVEIEWQYEAASKNDFFSSHISGAIRLENGNTLITSGEQQWLFEVSPTGKMVWEYRPTDEQMTRGENDSQGFRANVRPPLRPPNNQQNVRPPRGKNGQGRAPAGRAGVGGIFRSYRYLPNDISIRKVFEAIELERNK